MSLPRAPDRLSDDMAEALGHAVSAFGFLEEALKRATFSLTRQGLGESATEQALEAWLKRMEDLADDSLGTLIESFVAAMKQQDMPGRDALRDDLIKIRTWRNLLCHASWRPGEAPAMWYPTFINTRGQRHPRDLGPQDLQVIHADTLKAARRVVSIMRATGIDGQWAGEDDARD